MEFEFENTFDVNKYPEIAANPTLARIVEDKVAEMRRFMDMMKGGVRQMRSNVVVDGVNYKFLLRV